MIALIVAILCALCAVAAMLYAMQLRGVADDLQAQLTDAHALITDLIMEDE